MRRAQPGELASDVPSPSGLDSPGFADVGRSGAGTDSTRSSISVDVSVAVSLTVDVVVTPSRSPIAFGARRIGAVLLTRNRTDFLLAMARIIAAMRRGAPLPADIERRLATLGPVLEGHPAVRFAYVFGGAGRRDLRPLSDIDVAVYLDDAVDPVQARLDLIGTVTKHLATDEVDLIVLNRAPTALLGRILQSRRVIAEKDAFLRHRFESLALRKFLDFRLFERRVLDARFTRG